MTAPPLLYSFRRCPYAMRARMALIVSRRTCRLREVVLRDKPQAMLDASPKGTVPVLVLSDGTVIDESLDVMFWALNRSDPDGWLAPAHDSVADMTALIAENDGPFKAALDRYKYPTRYRDVDPAAERARGLGWLSELAVRLASSPYLFGARASLADVAIFPFVRQFANTDRAWFDETAPPALRRWLETWLEDPLFLAAMTKFPVWSPGAPEPLFPVAAA